MKQLFPAIFFLLIGYSFNSCDGDPAQYLPSFSGSPGELILVVDDALWDTEVGDVIRAGFQKPVPGIDHNEPSFSIMQYSQANFGDLLSLHRNIVQINIEDSDANDQARHQIRKNVWANGQLVIDIYARNADDFKDFFETTSDAYVAKINEEEKERIMSRFYNLRDVDIKKTMEEKYKLSINVPQDFKVVKETEDFIWIRRLMQKYLQGGNGMGGMYHDIDENIFIYSYPYTDTIMLNAEYQLSMRDSMCKFFVPGDVLGSYMTTEYQHFDPVYIPIEFKGNRGLEIRGLWKLGGAKGAFMGGPFIGLTCYDSNLDRIIYVEGNVFAPKFSKREYIRELEAMIYSIEPVQ